MSTINDVKTAVFSSINPVKEEMNKDYIDASMSFCLNYGIAQPVLERSLKEIIFWSDTYNMASNSLFLTDTSEKELDAIKKSYFSAVDKLMMAYHVPITKILFIVDLYASVLHYHAQYDLWNGVFEEIESEQEA